MTTTLAPAPAVQASVKKDVTNFAYILSANYSGSTLLAMLLGSQPEAVTVGEMRAPHVGTAEDYQCSCGQPIKQCQFWRDVTEQMAKRGVVGFDITHARLSIHETENRFVHRLLEPLPRGMFLETVRKTGLALSPAWPGHLQNVQRRNVALAEALREITGAKVVVDSSKIALHLRYLSKSPALKMKVIRLVRDGRAVTMSTLGHGFKRDTRRETIAGAALSWRKNNEAAERVLAEMPESQWKFLQYEELCRRPEETLRNLCGFLGMDTNRVVLDFRARTQHVLGNEMRLKSGSEIRLDERWRSGLSKEDLEIFEEVAGELNRKYGYE